MNKFTVNDLKRALVEVKELCGNTQCIECPLHKTEEDTDVPYCPLYEDEYRETVQFPVMWDIDDWKEDGKHETPDLKPCPFCGSEVKVYGPEDWHPTFYDPDSGGDPVSMSCDCGLTFCIGSFDYQETYEAWNRRASNNEMGDDQ